MIKFAALNGFVVTMAGLTAMTLAATDASAQQDSEVDTNIDVNAEGERPAPAEQDAGRAVIRFADINGIRNWKPSDDGKALYIEGRNSRWYKATFWAPCIGLRYTSELGFVTDGSGSLDRFSEVIADGERCRFKTFERTEAPDDEARQNER
jgi:hypothetical protein